MRIEYSRKHGTSIAPGEWPSYCRVTRAHQQLKAKSYVYVQNRNSVKEHSLKEYQPFHKFRRLQVRVATALNEAPPLVYRSTDSIISISRSNIYDSDGRICVKSLTLPELRRWFITQGERPSRADQLWRWLYGRRARTKRSADAVAVSAAASVLPDPDISESTQTAGNALRVQPRDSDIIINDAVNSVDSDGGANCLGTDSVIRAGFSAVGGDGDSYFGGGLRRLADAAEPAVDGFSIAFIRRFSPRLSLDGGLQLQDVSAATDGTRKLVFRVTTGEAAGGRIETVLIPWYRDYDPRVGRQEQPRYTLCVSSQVGCAMNCQFCFTGRRGLLGNLSTAQIIEQVLVAQQLLEREAFHTSAPAAPPAAKVPSLPPPGTKGSNDVDRGSSSQSPPPLAAGPITNLVFMGMGEPLHNCSAVFAALDILTHRRGLSMSGTRITLSTVGLLPQLQDFLNRFGPPPLTPPPHSNPHMPTAGAPSRHLSLHAETDAPAAGGTAAASAASASFASDNGAATSTSTSASTTATSMGPTTTSAASSSSFTLPSCSSSASAASLRAAGPLVSLAVSIHAGTDQLRTALVPSNSRLALRAVAAQSPLPGLGAESGSSLEPPVRVEGADEVVLGAAAVSVPGGGGLEGDGGALRGLAALCSVLSRHYPRTDRRPLKAGRYVLFEYTLLGGVNDRPEDAEALLRVTRHIECSFNLIMFNPFPGTLYVPSTVERVREFQAVLRGGTRIVHVRHSKGDSSMAACGQLGDVGPGGNGRAGKVLPEAATASAAAAAAII